MKACRQSWGAGGARRGCQRAGRGGGPCARCRSGPAAALRRRGTAAPARPAHRRTEGATASEVADRFGVAGCWLPELLVFDSKVTTGAGLGATDAAGIRFLTLRHRNPTLMARLKAVPDREWTTVTLDRRGPHARPQVQENSVSVRGCSRRLRQIAVRGLATFP
jgi:hypothetical protein